MRTSVSAMLLSASILLSLCHSISSTSTYESFRRVHGGAALGEGARSYEARRGLFEQRKQEALAHNALNLSWKVAVNRFSDHTDSELQAMLGHRSDMGRRGIAIGPSSSFMEIHEHGDEVDVTKLATEVDWRSTMMKSGSWVRNQGSCGSCWAVASVGALEMHAEKVHGSTSMLSHQQLVDCVENPRSCGGTGGCNGATAELAYEFTRKNGISSDDVYKSAADGKCNTQAASSLSVGKFVRLPINKASNLLHALATQGPVVVSADGGAWFGYDSGVFSGCAKDTVVNHAVLAVGYGNDTATQKKFWLVRNSWGPEWGEKGFIKVERHAGDSDYCGTDDKPKDGVFCKDAPASVPICGMCGITSDSVYPDILPKTDLSATQQNKVTLRAGKLVTKFQMDTGGFGIL